MLLKSEADTGLIRHYNTIPTPPPVGGTKRKIELLEKERDETPKRACPLMHKDRSQAIEWCRFSPLQNDGRRRSLIGEPPPMSLSHSPRETGSSMGLPFVQSQSPSQAAVAGLTLPSPSSLSFSSNILPPISPRTGPSQSVHASHLQDLQHQISTKTLALQTLQREHDNLLAAFSRSQIRCATLDKKFQVSDTEINSLTEERIKLMSQVEAFETQVEELISSREEARKQSVANGGQYMKIMAMASRLEGQGAADRKKWTLEKEEWEQEKAGLRQKILTHEKIIDNLQLTEGMPVPEPGRKPAPLGTSPPLKELALSCSPPTHSAIKIGAPEPEADDLINSMSLETLRSEISRLRKSCQELEAALQDLRLEGQRVDQVMQELSRIRRRIEAKTTARPCPSAIQHQPVGGQRGEGNEVEVRPSAFPDMGEA